MDNNLHTLFLENNLVFESFCNQLFGNNSSTISVLYVLKYSGLRNNKYVSKKHLYFVFLLKITLIIHLEHFTVFGI